ncbi:MAG: nucleotidyl transferase AbiEii/AbiGii toxin family protein [Verrucomicrobiota bacterium]
MELQKDIREFVELLLSENVEFLLVGGYAMAVHGAPRFTEDIDFLIHLSSENAERLLKVIQKFGFGDLEIEKKDLLKPDFVIQLGMAPNRIDLLTSIDGLEWNETWESKIEFELDGLPLFVIGRDQLIQNKLASGRSQDIADAERLQQGK